MNINMGSLKISGVSTPSFFIFLGTVLVDTICSLAKEVDPSYANTEAHMWISTWLEDACEGVILQSRILQIINMISVI